MTDCNECENFKAKKSWRKRSVLQIIDPDGIVVQQAVVWEEFCTRGTHL